MCKYFGHMLQLGNWFDSRLHFLAEGHSLLQRIHFRRGLLPIFPTFRNNHEFQSDGFTGLA